MPDNTDNIIIGTARNHSRSSIMNLVPRRNQDELDIFAYSGYSNTIDINNSTEINSGDNNQNNINNNENNKGHILIDIIPNGKSYKNFLSYFTASMFGSLVLVRYSHIASESGIILTIFFSTICAVAVVITAISLQAIDCEGPPIGR